MITVWWSKHFGCKHCYTKMFGKKTQECCSGLCGGDYTTEYLQCQCMGCSHLNLGGDNKCLK